MGIDFFVVCVVVLFSLGGAHFSRSTPARESFFWKVWADAYGNLFRGELVN